MLAPLRREPEGMFSGARPGEKNDCVSTTQAHLRARTA